MQKNKGLRKLRKMRGHFLLCGWRPGFEKILDSVLNSNPDITPDMIVLINDATEQVEQIRSQARFKELNYVAGDFADEATLKRAQIENAERALVICDRSKSYSDLEIDSRTVLAVLTMENINPGIYIAAELIDAKFQKHLELAHCDEIILTQDYEHSLLATASSGMGYSNVIRALISDDADTGILVEDIPQSFIGKTYGEYEAHIEKTDPANGVLVGLLLNTGNFHQRRKDALREAQKNPDIKKIVDNLKKVKTLKSNETRLTPPNDFIIQKNTKAIIVRG
jgi:voltage-gated potassium channel